MIDVSTCTSIIYMYTNIYQSRIYMCYVQVLQLQENFIHVHTCAYAGALYSVPNFLINRYAVAVLSHRLLWVLSYSIHG